MDFGHDFTCFDVRMPTRVGGLDRRLRSLVESKNPRCFIKPFVICEATERMQQQFPTNCVGDQRRGM